MPTSFQSLQPFRNALYTIPGVNGTGRTSVDGKPALKVNVESAQDAKFVDQLVSDRIEGFEVSIKEIGLIQARVGGKKQKALSADEKKEKVLDTLAQLPGATGSGITEVGGEEALTVYAETAKDIKFLDAFLEDRIMGQKVAFVEQGPVSFEIGFG